MATDERDSQPRGPIDFYVGGQIGMWALESVSPSSLGHIFTMNEQLAAWAKQRFPDVHLGNANSIGFTPSQVGFSVHYERIIRSPLLGRYRKLYNLHPGYLPWGKGYFPVFWALWEQTPAGATLHEINEGIDEGAIVSQAVVTQEPDDTGGSLHARVIEVEKSLFRTFWPQIRDGQFPAAYPQPAGGAYHSKADFFNVKQNIDVQKLSGADFIRLARALSFPGYTGLELKIGHKRHHLVLEPMDRE